jgi:hypothetical protein
MRTEDSAMWKGRQGTGLFSVAKACVIMRAFIHLQKTTLQQLSAC